MLAIIIIILVHSSCIRMHLLLSLLDACTALFALVVWPSLEHALH